MATPQTTQQPALDFAVLYVSDLEASFALFTDKLGFGTDPAQNNNTFRILIGSSGPGFGLMRASDQTPLAGTVELYFTVDDVRRFREQVVARGVEATAVETRPFGTIFSVHTGDGTPITMLTEPATAGK